MDAEFTTNIKIYCHSDSEFKYLNDSIRLMMHEGKCTQIHLTQSWRGVHEIYVQGATDEVRKFVEDQMDKDKKESLEIWGPVCSSKRDFLNSYEKENAIVIWFNLLTEEEQDSMDLDALSRAASYCEDIIG